MFSPGGTGVSPERTVVAGGVELKVSSLCHLLEGPLVSPLEIFFCVVELEATIHMQTNVTLIALEPAEFSMGPF